MKERNLGWYLSLATLVAMGAVCAGLYYFALTLPPATPAPIETATATPVPTHTPAPSPIAIPSVTSTPTMTPTATPMATGLPVKTVIKTSTPTSMATAIIAPTATPETCQIAANEIYIIRRGDSMWKIARCAYGEPGRWVEICAANPQVSDCHWIHAGNPLIIPRWR